MTGAATSGPLHEACTLIWDRMPAESQRAMLRRYGIRATDPSAFGTLVGKIGTAEFVRLASRIGSEPSPERGNNRSAEAIGLVPTWTMSRGRPFADVVSILVDELGPERLRYMMTIEDVSDLNWWLQGAPSGQVQDLLWRCRSSIRPARYSEAWSRYLSERRQLDA